MQIKPKYLTAALAGLAIILVGYGILRSALGPFLPKAIDENLPNAVIVAALGIFLLNRKLRTDQQKAAAEKAAADKAAADEAEAAKTEEGGGRTDAVGIDEGDGA